MRLRLIVAINIHGEPHAHRRHLRPRSHRHEDKDRAADALEAMDLSISDATRLLMLRIADERRLLFEVKVPNATTRKAIAELESGKGKRFASVKALMADLHADD